MPSAAPNRSTPFVIQCPSCHRRLKVDPAKLGSARKCPACHASLSLQLVSESTADSAQVDFDPPQPPEYLPRSASGFGLPPGPPPPAPAFVDDGDQPDFPDDFADTEYNGRRSRRASRSRGWSLRAKHWLVWGLIRFGLSLAMIAVSPLFPPIGILGLLVLLWYWPARWLARRVCAAIFPTFTCRGCGFEIDAVGQWSLGGYTDHRERHILLVKSPLDKTFIGHSDCPQCGATNFV